ncbi:MAG: YdjY domain-containing protein [bacterium]
MAPAAAASTAAVKPAAPITKEVTTRFQRRQEARRLAEMPRPAEIPRPEGEPRGPEDLQKLSDAAAGGQPVDKPGAPPIERVDEFRVRIGKMLVDRQARTIQVPAKLNMTEGILEYYAVASNGKLHESVLELEGEPSHIHLGLILLGVEQIKYDYGDFRGPPKVVQPGGRLALWIKYADLKSGKEKRIPAEEFLYNRAAKGPPKPLPWAFTGSNFWNNRYGADMDRSTIALIPDQVAVIGTTDDAGNPYRGEGLGFEVNTKVVPPKGTALTLEIAVLGDGKTPPP